MRNRLSRSSVVVGTVLVLAGLALTAVDAGVGAFAVIVGLATAVVGGGFGRT